MLANQLWKLLTN